MGCCPLLLLLRDGLPIWLHAGGRQMKTPDPTNAESSAPNARKFTGTDNPRQLRAIAVLMRRPIPRESLDDAVGASNSPELVADLRRRGLEVPCGGIKLIDRDGWVCRPSVYSFTSKDRCLIWAWQARMRKGTHG